MKFVALGIAELQEVLATGNIQQLCIAGVVDFKKQALHLINAAHCEYTVPFSYFKNNPKSVPNFDAFDIIDYGQTIKLGDYEAAFDAIVEQFAGNS